MSYNGYRVKTNAELSPYQKRIESIDNVILCVAEAEKLVALVGKQVPLCDEDRKVAPGPGEVLIGCEFPWDETVAERAESEA
jgi:hypothetical protein